MNKILRGKVRMGYGGEGYLPQIKVFALCDYYPLLHCLEAVCRPAYPVSPRSQFQGKVSINLGVESGGRLRWGWDQAQHFIVSRLGAAPAVPLAGNKIQVAIGRQCDGAQAAKLSF